MNWNNYYMEQAGGSSDFSNVYKGAPWQRGYGMGGIFGKFMSWVMPMIKEQAFSTLKSGAKAVGKEALSGISNITSDISQGKDCKTSAQENATKTVSNLKEKAENYFKGKGIKRKKKLKNLIILKKRQKKSKQLDDIFSQNAVQ